LHNPVRVLVFGPSKRFLSGITYFTIRLANALNGVMNVQVVQFRHMLPKFLFPGRKRVGEDLLNERYEAGIKTYDFLDWFNPFSWARAFSITRKADAVVFPWWTSSVAHMYFFIELLCRKKKIIIIEYHEAIDPLEDSIFILSLYAKLMGKIIPSLACRYVAHTRFDRDLIIGRYHLPVEKISIIPHGLYDQYKKIGRAEAKEALSIKEEYVILFFGLLRPFKGVKFLIEGFEGIPKELMANTRLFIVGEAWEDRESVDRARRSEYRDNITVVDRYISDDEVSLYFSASDVFVAPYTRESHDPSAVAHIAMSYGMPVIASRVGGIKESLGTYEGTVFVEPENPGEIAKAIQALHGDRVRYPVPPELRWNVIAQQWDDLIRTIMQEEMRQ